MAVDTSMNVAIKAASYNMVLQIVFRFGTFFMNAVLLRHISREILGIVNVRLTLLYTTILFISREPFRKACLSRSENANKSKSNQKGTINLIWICMVVGFVSSFCLSLLWIYCFDKPSVSLIHQYKRCTILFALSCLHELLIEPLWIYGQRFSFITLKVILEGVFVTLRCVLSVILVIFVPNLGLYAFGIAFIVSSLVYVALYYGYFWWYIKNSFKEEDKILPFTNFRELFPDFTTPCDLHYRDLVLSFYKQSLLKQFLTEGERYIMTVFSILSFAEQGVYDVINNLGSLAARFIFMPIEESYYTYFSQVLMRGKNANEHSVEQLNKAITSLCIVLKFVSLVGLIIVVFGYSYSFLLLDLYGGQILSAGEGPTLLKTYCAYVLIIAINGITECFMFAVMSKEQINKYNYKMMIFSVAFLVASLLLTKYFGSLGFILANCLNMLLRIIESVFFIQRFFKDSSSNPLVSIIPTKGVMLSLLISFIFTFASEGFVGSANNPIYQLVHVLVGGACLVMVAAAIYLTEHEFILFVTNLLRQKKNKRE